VNDPDQPDQEGGQNSGPEKKAGDKGMGD